MANQGRLFQPRLSGGQEMTQYTNKYFDTICAYPLGIIPNNKKLPLRVRFALWLFGFKKEEDKK